MYSYMDALDETYLSEVHSKRRDDSQSSLSNFTSNSKKNELGTAIAVVTDPTGGILDVCDEHISHLGMPKAELNNFRSVRSDLEIEDDVKRHNKAVDITEIDEKYEKYIKNNSKAQEKISKIARRIEKGEKITLVCFEKEPKWCHRHLLVEEIRNELGNDWDIV